jgi:hypothetical protein
MCCCGERNSFQKLCVVYIHSHRQQPKIKPREYCSLTLYLQSRLKYLCCGSLGYEIVCVVCVCVCVCVCVFFFLERTVLSPPSNLLTQVMKTADFSRMLVSTYQATHSDDNKDNHIVILHHCEIL